MLEEAARYGEILAIAVAVAGVAIIVTSVVFRRGIIFFAIGVVVAAAALVAPMLIRGQPVSVIVVKQRGGEIEFVRRDGFHGGAYTARNGRRIAIERRRRWGRTASFLINDSDRLVTVTGHQYSAIRHAGGRAELLSYLLPLEYRAFPRRISFTGDDVTGPPKTIRAEGAAAGILFLAYSRKPYDPAAHGDESTLEARLALPQVMPRMAFATPAEPAVR